MKCKLCPEKEPKHELEKCRIQYAYRLDPVDLAWGYIMGVQTEVGLQEEDNCEEKIHFAGTDECGSDGGDWKGEVGGEDTAEGWTCQVLP